MKSNTNDTHRIKETDIDERRLDLERERLALEKEKINIDNRFLQKHFGLLLTTIVSVSAILFSLIQFHFSQRATDQELELKAIEFLTDKHTTLFGKDAYEKREQIKAALDGIFP